MPEEAVDTTTSTPVSFPNRNRLREFLYSALDFLYPRRCVGCGTEGIWFCAACQAKVVRVQTLTCFFCQSISPDGKTCDRCRASHALTGVMVFGYHEGVLKDAIHSLKYDFVQELADPLGSMLATTIYAKFHSSSALLVPIPLHRSRLRSRGFNQSDLLAASIVQRTGLTIGKSLLRTKNVTPQVELSGQARRKNMEGVFVWKGGKLDGKTIVLVDDVATTGTTLDQAAKVLRKAGARQVWGAVIGKG